MRFRVQLRGRPRQTRRHLDIGWRQHLMDALQRCSRLQMDEVGTQAWRLQPCVVCSPRPSYNSWNRGCKDIPLPCTLCNPAWSTFPSFFWREQLLLARRETRDQWMQVVWVERALPLGPKARTMLVDRCGPPPCCTTSQRAETRGTVRQEPVKLARTTMKALPRNLLDSLPIFGTRGARSGNCSRQF